MKNVTNSGEILLVVKNYTTSLIEDLVSGKVKEIADEVAKKIINEYEVKDMIFKQLPKKKGGEILVLVSMKPTKKLKKLGAK